VLTGKGTDWGGALVRTEATGYGAALFANEMLKARGESLDGMTCLVSGSGNVALYAIEKIHQLGGRVIACSDSDGVVVDDKGIDIELLKQIKEVERGRVRAYAERRADARHLDRGNIWEVPCDVALPCATQNELTGRDAKLLAGNGCTLGAEGANMPHHTRGHSAVRRRRDRVRSRQSRQRRRRRDLGTGDATERKPRLVDICAH
jgi:glutamate dehydrogenase (NADP+)